MEARIAAGAALLILLSSLLLLTSAAEEPDYGEFTAELRGRELVVGSACKGSWLGATDTFCEIDSETVSTLVRLTTCPQASPYQLTEDNITTDSATVFSTSKTLVTHIGGHSQNCTGNAGCQWTVELAEEFLSESSCIDVHVADFTTAFPPLRGISKRIWMPMHVQDEGSRVTNITELPQCLENTELLQWSAAQVESCSDNTRSFSPTNVYSVSTTETFVTANSSIIYSPCRGCMWYQLLLPTSSSIISFAHVSNMFYALLATSESEGVEVWLGVTGGVSPLLRVYPSPALEWMWDRDTASLNSFLVSASLALDSQGHLVAVNGEGEEIRLPVSLLLSHAFYNYFSTTSNGSTPPISSLHLSTNSGTPSLEDRPHPLLLLPQTSLMCPLTRVLVEAPVCDSVTRSVVEIERRGFLESVDHELLPWLNCHVMSDSLPADVFLRLGESYVFTVHLHLNPLLAGYIDVDELQLVPTLSRPDTIEVATERTFHTNNNTVMYLVSLRERSENRAQIQVPPSTVLQSVDVHLQVRGVEVECVHPLNPRPELLGRMKTSVHVGCPPGLSLVFDHLATQASDNQFCTSTNRISCYYFGNEFRPEMRLVDSVTGEKSTYTGPYSLRVLAGGTSSSDMQSFSPNVQSQIWTASADDIISHNSNKIEWMCGLNSPCGEILPGSGGSPEYYLLIQASNREVGVGGTYCDLTVEFVIRVHGMSMGPISMSVIIIVLLMVLVVPVVSLFLVWVWREKRGERRVLAEEEEVREKWSRRWVDRGREMAAQLWLRIKEMTEENRQTRQPLEPHLHTE